MASSSISVSVLADVSNINRNLSSVEGRLGRFGKTAGRLKGALVGAFAATAVVSAVKSVVSAASDAQQSLGATETVFGKYSQGIVSASKAAATQVGLDQNTYRESANLIGSLFKNQGVATDQLVGKTKAMVKTGADLAATFGGTTTTAVEALGSAFKGEFDPLEKYGISIKQSTVNTKAQEIATKKYGKSLKDLSTKQQTAVKQQATSALISKQSASSLGAFGKESDTLAHQQQVLGAQFTNLKVTLGTFLLPILTKVFTFINNNFNPAIKAIGDFMGPIVAKVKTFFSGLSEGQSQASPIVAFIQGQLLPAFAGIATALQGAYAVVLPILQQIAAAFTATWGPIQPQVQSIFNSIKTFITSVLSIIQSVITGFTIVVSAVWGVFGATILKYATTTFKNIVSVISGALKIVSGIFKVIASVLKGDWRGAWNGIKQIVSGATQIIKAVVSQFGNGLKTTMRLAGDAIKTIFRLAWNALKDIVKTAIGKVVTEARGIKDKIKSGVGNLSGLLVQAGKDVIQGLINGIGAMIGALKSKLAGITKLIPLHKGPPSKDKRLLTPAGKAIMAGLIAGLTSGEDDLTKALENITTLVEKVNKKKYDSAKKARKESKKDLKALKDETAALKANLSQRNKVAASLATAQAALADLKKKAADYADAIKTSFTAFGNIVNNDADNPVTSDSIVTTLAAKVKQARDYAKTIKALTAKGLNKTTIQQLIDAGVEGGSATAKALLKGGTAAVRQVNSLTSQLGSVGQDLGNKTAHTMYGAGIAAAQGLVNGLKSQAAALAKAATTLAQAMVKAIKKALGIHSPSRVFKRLGVQTLNGLQVGLKNTNGVETQMRRVSSTVVKSFDPSLYATAGTGGNGAVTIEVNFNGLVTDKIGAGREVVSAVKEYYAAGGKRL